MEWRPVRGFEGVYEVSEAGNIRRLVKGGKARVGVFLTPSVTERGYLYHRLSFAGRTKKLKVHRLVLEAFVGPGNGLWGLHADDDPTNNHISNLRWGTPVENSEDRRRNRPIWNNGRQARTACPKGHAYTAENTIMQTRRDRRGPSRKCRECVRRAGVDAYRRRISEA